ncbi:hypothetical protein C8Q78DRAFT_387835 [Trametes maxima]|nr:hypothetical protein C8Q78DRAFT_387835 [Trametes maxima]
MWAIERVRKYSNTLSAFLYCLVVPHVNGAIYCAFLSIIMKGRKISFPSPDWGARRTSNCNLSEPPASFNIWMFQRSRAASFYACVLPSRVR